MLKSMSTKDITVYNDSKQKWKYIIAYYYYTTYTLSIAVFVLIIIIPLALVSDCLITFFNFSFWLCLFILITFGIILAFVSSKFYDEIPLLSKLDTFLYFNIYTKKGKAIERQQFNSIKKNYYELYKLISSQKTAGECYAISYELLQLFKEGMIVFLAIADDDSSTNKKINYHMHVLYVNNGYAFDTDFCLQIPYDKYLSSHKAKIFKAFSFDDVKNLTFWEFRDAFHPRLVAWCKTHQIFLWTNCPVVE